VKKQIHIDDIQKIIMDNRECRVSDKETYLLLQEQYYDKKTLARIIKTTTTYGKIAHYKPMNILLLVLYFLLSAIFLACCFLSPFSSLFVLGYPVFCYIGRFLKYDFNSYRVMLGTTAAIALSPLFSFFNHPLTNLQLIMFVINTILSISIIILTIYIKRKLFMSKKERELLDLN